MKRAKLHPPPKPRNPVARSPLLRKGGVHDKAQGARRRAANMAVQQALRRGTEDE